MRVAILSAGEGWHTRELQRALRERGCRGEVLPIHELIGRIGAGERLASGGAALSGCAAALVRIIPRGSLEQIVFRMDALHRLERSGVVVLNPAGAIERCTDKFYASALLEEAGIPTPRTVVTERMEDALTAFREMGDVVVKPLFGANGRGMVRVGDEEIAWRVFRALEMERAIAYVQQFIPHAGRDVRAFVVGERVVAAAWRTADDWRTNRSRGGKMQALRLPPAWEERALRAAAVVGAEFAGVDLLPADDGEVYVLEVNGIPGWRGLQGTTEVDVAGAMVDHLRARVEG